MNARLGSASATVDLVLRGLRFVRHLPQFARLYWRLLWDRRVPIWPKVLLIGAAVYVLSPIDLVPDFIPILGEVDDLVLAIAACRMFMHLCPREVVEEHVRRISVGG